uniref:hypothetical protein n=1 Tax=Wolbachia endosymbiont of Chironomus riparius TaxID=2883238 RepID=UPI0035122931
MGNTFSSIFGKISENSPVKELEKRKRVVSVVNEKVGSTLAKNSVFSDGNPLLSSSIWKEISQNSWKGFKIKHEIEERKSTLKKEDLKENIKSEFENKIFNQSQHNYFNISIQAGENQNVRSLADEVIKRIREKSRDVLFDTAETFY